MTTATLRPYLRPYVTTGLAIVGASVIAITPVAAPAHDVAAPLRAVAVKPTSVVTGLLDNFATVVNAASTSVIIAGESIAVLPFEVAQLAGTALGNPSLIPSLASLLVNDYLNPNQAF